jgi:hypothetical protein
VFSVLAVALIAGFAAGCAETTSNTGAPKSAAVTPTRSEIVDPGQPIVLTGGSPAGPVEPGATTASVSGANEAGASPPSPRHSPKVAAAQQAGDAPRAASAIVEPSASDILSPQPSNDGVTVQDNGAGESQTAVISDTPPAATPAPTGQGTISASAKAKLIGELKALKKRPGAEASTQAKTAAPDDGQAPDAKCPEGSLDPQCLAAAD